MPDVIVEISLICIECELVARGNDAAGWRAYLTCDDPPEVGIYCPDCADQEFRVEWPYVSRSACELRVRGAERPQWSSYPRDLRSAPQHEAIRDSDA